MTKPTKSTKTTGTAEQVLSSIPEESEPWEWFNMTLVEWNAHSDLQQAELLLTLPGRQGAFVQRLRNLGVQIRSAVKK